MGVFLGTKSEIYPALRAMVLQLKMCKLILKSIELDIPPVERGNGISSINGDINMF